jgi:hypothetical protein
LNRRDLFKLAAGAAVVPLALPRAEAEIVKHDEENCMYEVSGMKFREEFIHDFEQRQALLAELKSCLAR